MNFISYIGLIRDPSAICYEEPGQDVDNGTPETRSVFISDVAELPLVRLGLKHPYESLTEARRAASVDLDADLKAFLPVSFPVQKLYSGSLGKDSYTQFLSVPDQVARLSLKPHFRRGGTLVIREIGMLLSVAVPNLTIGLYSDEDINPIKSVTLSIEAKSVKRFSVGEVWKVPSDGTRYELRATLPTGVKVGDNNIACCQNARDLPTVFANCCDGKASGFMLTLNNDCNYDSLLEQLVQDDRTGLVIRYMLAYQAAYRLCAKPTSGEVERSTVLSETDLANAASLCRTEYLNRLNWLKTEVPRLNLNTDHACYQAARPYGWARSGVFR